jgi:Ser/Thr protein kinase RdoA (MazF antagonist)
MGNPVAVRDVLAGFDLGDPLDVSAAGGTASPKWAVTTEKGRYMVRVRPAEFASEDAARFDHEVLRRLLEAGLPVPAPVPRPDGSTWLKLNGRLYEVLGWIEGKPWDETDPDIPASIGSFLARFHTVLSTEAMAAGKKRAREDHPDLVSPYLDAVRARPTGRAAAKALEEVSRQLDLVRTELDGGLYKSLPHGIIHGDFHPGNIRFSDSQVAAVYDFDYVDNQARARDLSDAILFFASSRRHRLNPDDIRSLTQPMAPDLGRASRLISGYQTGIVLTDAEWRALPLLMRSRWLQMRLRGTRKIAEPDRVDFVLDGFFDVIGWLGREAPVFFKRLRQVTRIDQERT